MKGERERGVDLDRGKREEGERGREMLEGRGEREDDLERGRMGRAEKGREEGGRMQRQPLASDKGVKGLKNGSQLTVEIDGASRAVFYLRGRGSVAAG